MQPAVRVFDDMETLPEFQAPVVTVGSFDGVHRGHKHLLEVARAKASESRGEVVVVTFSDHPRRVVEPNDEVMVLNTLEEKTLLLEKEGVDNLVVLDFDEAMKNLSAEEFVRDILVAKIGVNQLIMGYNHRLGRDRAGDVAELKRLGEKYGFKVHEAGRLGGGEGGQNAGFCGKGGGQARGGEKISSTEIRKALARGDLAAAERMLGRRLK